MKVGKLKQLSKKSLSVLLAVIMIMTSMSVCFGTISFAAGGTVSDYTALANALNKDTVKNATWDTTTTNGYTVYDTNGDVLAAVEAYWSAFETLANKDPATGDPNNTTASTGSSESNRVINQVNNTIKAGVKANLGSAYDTAIETFLTRLTSGANVSTDTGTSQSMGGFASNDKTVPDTNLSEVADISVTVDMTGSLMSYTLENLPSSILKAKTFTVSHANDRYDYTYKYQYWIYTRTYKYFYYISDTSATDGDTLDTSLLTQTRDLLAGYKDYFSYDMYTLVSKDVNTLASVKTAVNNAKTNVVNSFSESIWKHFFATEYDVDALNTNIDLATSIIAVKPITDNLIALKNAGYDSMDEAALRNLHSQLTVGLQTYDNSDDVVKNYIDGKGFVRSDIQAFADEVLAEIKLIELRKLKQTIDSTIPTYYTYNENNVAGLNATVSGATLSAAKGTVDGFITSINSYPAVLVNQVMSGYTDTLGALSNDLSGLIKISGYNDLFSAEYAKYVAEVYGATDLNADSETLLEGIKGYDEWYTGLKTLIGTIESELGATVADKIMTDLDDAMKAHMDSVYTTLHARVLAQIDIATELYAVIVALNGKLDVLTVNNYSKYKRAFNTIDTDSYYFLKDEAQNYTMPQTTIDKFNALGDDFTKYEEFIATGGFSSFAQQFIDYENRDVLDNDLVRDEEYEVTKEKLENVVKGLDTIITSDAVGGLLGGLLGGEEGEGFDIGEMLKGLIQDALFTDSFINTVVKMLYPLVLSEFVKVWANDLPTTVTLGTTTFTVNYSKDLQTTLGDAGFEIYPALLASKLDETKYSENIALLNAALASFRETYGTADNAIYTTVEKNGKKATDKTPWDAPVLYKNGDTGGELALTWGVDAAKEKVASGEMTQEDFADFFYNAFDDAVEGLKPLLLALIANKSWEADTVEELAYVTVIAQIWVSLDLSATGNSGYANLLVPIYEALGVDYVSVSDVENELTKKENDVAAILEAILDPIFGLFEKLGEKPVDTIISILPNLCYALSMQVVPSLLSMLKTDIKYAANASLGCDIEAASGAANINVGDMLGLEDMGVDLSNGINSLLKMFGLDLPEIDQGLVAQLGTLGTIDTQRKESTYNRDEIGTDKAYYITADKAAVGYYLLTYIFGIIEDEEAFKGLLGMFMDEVKIEETLASFDELGLFGHGVGNAIAAVVELFNQEENDNFGAYKWYDGAIYDGSTVTNLSPAMIEYLSYDNDLTREKAAYIVDHLDELISSILDMVNGDPEGTYSIAAELDKLIGGLFTNANITALAKALGGLDLNSLLAGSTEEAPAEDEDEPSTVAEGEEAEGEEAEEAATGITALLKDALGVNLGAFAKYKDIADDTNWDFTDGDGEGFAKALAKLLEPLSPVINFLLTGDDIVVLGATTLLGYNGYDTALVPLLEALDCEVAELKEGDNVIEVVLMAIVNKLETIIGKDADGKYVDAVEGLANLIPGILYFLQSNGLSTVVRNLLQPIYVILDTIRPVIDLDLNKLIADLTKDLGITIDLNHLDVDFVLNLVKKLVGLDFTALGDVIADVCKVAVDDYESKSSLIGENGRRGVYTELFDATDLVAVILNFAFDWFTVPENVDAMANVIGGDNAETVEMTKEYIAGIYALIEGIEPKYDTINWAYNFPEGFDEENVIFASGITIQPTIESLNYPTDWTEDTAKYIAENLDALITSALDLAGVEGTLSDMLKENINIFTGENLNKLVSLITDLLESINSEIVNNAGVLIGADLEALRNYKADETKTYTTVEFAQELAKILGVIPEVINLIFFADDFELFNYSDGKTVATVKGALGYAKGLAPILEALGCKNLPAADSKDVEGILVSIANRFDEILADPVNEILDILPNIIYFLNANGISVSVKNILSSVTGFMAQLKESFNVDVDLIKIINNAINGLLPEDSEVVIDANNLDLETLFTLVKEVLGLDLTAASSILVDLCVGKIEPFKSVSGDYGFRMVYDDAYARYDMITILVTVALELIENEQNAKALDELIGTKIMSGLKTVFESAPVVYATPDWDYCWAEDGIDYDNNTVEVVKYAITYPNNWTEESAKYVAENLGEIGDMIAGLIDSNYSSLGALVNDKVKIYSGENIEALVGAIAGLLGDIDDTLLNAAGLLLNVDIVGLKTYKAPEGIDTADEFAAELANVLTTYAGGLIDWLLFGEDYRFFVDETALGENNVYDEGEEIITINGGLGYANGLALILEALGADLTGAETVEEILKATFARLDAILANPVVEIFNLLPNLLYFLNANGVAIAFDNLLAAVTTLINKLAVFGLELDMAELIDIEGLLGIEEDLMISIDNLTIEAILELAAYLTGFDLDLLKDVLVGFALGEVKEYPSVSRTGVTYKMYYNDEFAVYDMITVLANLVVLTVKDDDNAEKMKELLGEDIYTVIINVFNMGEVPVQEFDWKFTDKADTGYVFSALSTSELYANHQYGPLYTEDMAQYIADNMGEFIDNIIYLLGISIDGKNVDSLKELINGLVNGSLYNSKNIIAIRDALTGVLAGIGNMQGGEHIKAILKSSLGVDLDAVAKVDVPEFDNDRAQFTQYLCAVVEPLYPVLKWILADEDFTFFVDEDKTDLITLKGAEGYAFGIVPLLEVLECENVLSTEEYYAEVEADGNVLITSILTPLLDRVDVIMEDPAEAILSMLPDLIYFINSNGIDTVVKNTLNAVYTLLNAIEPIAKIDIYELIGLDLSTLTFEKLFEMLIDMIAESTGYRFSTLDASAVAELSVGTLVSYTSKNGKTAYKMIYQSEGAEAEMVTVVMRLVITFIMHENNREMLLGLLRDNLDMNEDAEMYIRSIFDMFATISTETYLGMDQALATLYYVFYGLDLAVDKTSGGLKDVNAKWQQILKDMGKSDDPNESSLGNALADFLDTYFEDIFTSEGIAPNGILAFFQKIISFFQRIIEFIKNLFA